MNRISSLAMGLIFLFSPLQFAMAKTKCEFDPNTFNVSRYKNNNLVKNVVWDDKQNKASIITAKGDLVSVQHWSCNHRGLQALMLVSPYDFEQANHLGKNYKELANVVLNDTEKKLVFNLLDKKGIPYDVNAKIVNLKNDKYTEFYLGYTTIRESVLLEIKYVQIKVIDR